MRLIHIPQINICRMIKVVDKQWYERTVVQLTKISTVKKIIYIFMYYKIFFCSGNLPIFLVKTWQLEAALFAGKQLAGLNPSLYSEDPDATQATVKSDPLGSEQDCQIFLHGEVQDNSRGHGHHQEAEVNNNTKLTSLNLF